jgi:hypothetical protein
LPKKRKKLKQGVCVYCGCEAGLTEDHIPPQSLYPPELHSKLLLVPSCAGCNGGASKDDEYLRTIIGLSAKGQGEETLKPLSEASVRALVAPSSGLSKDNHQRYPGNIRVGPCWDI